jgi:DNA-binding NtrC family response regulator
MNDHILIIEDELVLLNLFTIVLRDAGFDVCPVATLQAARDMLAKQHFDLVLMDMQIGYHNGIDLLKEFFTLQDKGTRIVALSGHAQYSELCNSLGIEFRLKPISNHELVDLVARRVAS